MASAPDLALWSDKEARGCGFWALNSLSFQNSLTGLLGFKATHAGHKDACYPHFYHMGLPYRLPDLNTERAHLV